MPQGRRVNPEGYVYLQMPGHPLADKAGQVAEHRLVAYEAGMLVDLGDHVHHRNGITGDNRLENLEVLDPGVHLARHRQRPIPHGTRGAYTNRKCRCNPCAEADRSYQRSRRSALIP